MLLHQFSDDFITSLQLLLHGIHLPLCRRLRSGCVGLAFTRGSPALEELLLPLVEQRGMNLVLIADIRHRRLDNRMLSKYRHFVLGTVMRASTSGHDWAP